MRLPRNSTCASVARGLLDDYGRDALDEQEREDAMLVVSELAANAFCHGEGVITLSIRRAGDRLRIDILDEGRLEQLRAVPADQKRASGRGLWIVEQLASEWGVVAGSGHVWAELAPGRG